MGLSSRWEFVKLSFSRDKAKGVRGEEDSGKGSWVRRVRALWGLLLNVGLPLLCLPTASLVGGGYRVRAAGGLGVGATRWDANWGVG